MQGWLSTEVEVEARQLSAGDWVRLVWGVLWRAGVLALLAVAVALGVCALASPLSGHSPPLRHALLRVAVGGAGLVALPFYLRWLLWARFGTLRLALIRTSKSS